MKHARWHIILGISLVSLSVLFYSAHFLIFGDPHHIFIYLLGDIAFVPIEVLIVTMIIHKLLEEREKRSRIPTAATFRATWSRHTDFLSMSGWNA